jgi:hypothetical protein
MVTHYLDRFCSNMPYFDDYHLDIYLNDFVRNKKQDIREKDFSGEICLYLLYLLYCFRILVFLILIPYSLLRNSLRRINCFLRIFCKLVVKKHCRGIFYPSRLKEIFSRGLISYFLLCRFTAGKVSFNQKEKRYE